MFFQEKQVPAHDLSYATIMNDSSKSSGTLQSVRYDASGKTLEVLDQKRIPQETVYVPVPNAEEAWGVIQRMQVRGAPLIGIVAALGLGCEISRTWRSSSSSPQEFALWIGDRLRYLKTSRPTAVNLRNYADELEQIVSRESNRAGATLQSVAEAYIGRSEALLEEDLGDNKRIGDFGADALVQAVVEATGQRPKAGLRVLTICNTGSLATAGYGTALGVIRSLHDQGLLERAFACETRPYNQGARLTAFELVSDRIPATLIGDSMASFLMASQGVDAVVVGCDRVTRNGDFANKIGTYMLAVAAKYHKVPFFVAGVTGTVDFSTLSGKDIPIEHRPAEELTRIMGRPIGTGSEEASEAPVTVQVAAEGIDVWNPAFDVTPHELVTGLITEKGTIWRDKQTGEFNLNVSSPRRRQNSGSQQLASCRRAVSSLEDQFLPYPLSFCRMARFPFVNK